LLIFEARHVQAEDPPASWKLTYAKAVELSEPVNLPKTWDSTPCLSANGLEFVFTSTRDGWGTYVATRTNTSEPFRETKKITGGNHGVLSADGLSLYFNATGPHGEADIFVARRANLNGEWKESEALGETVNSPQFERWAAISKDGLELYFTRTENFEPEVSTIYCAKRNSTSDAFGQAEELPSIVNDGTANSCSLSPDGLLLLFVSNREGGNGGSDIWIARREDRNSAWKEVVNAGPNVNSPESEWQPLMTLDGRKLLFSRSPKEVDWDDLQSSIFEANVVRE
jgi:Tol biopolymer transport system component